MRSGAGTGKPSVGLIICVSLISQLRNLMYLRHLKSKSPFLKVELGHDLTQHLFFEWDEAEPGFVSHSPDNSISNTWKLPFLHEGL